MSLPPADQGTGLQGSIFRARDLRLARYSGFTLIELIVVTIIIVIVMGVMLNRFTYYQEQAEKAAMENMAGALQSALTLQVGQVLTRGRMSDLAALAEDNPMNWLQQKPHNYAGEFYALTPRAVDSGNWVFDLKSRELVYVLHNSKYFKPGKEGYKWIRFHVVVNYEASLLPSLRDEPAQFTGALFRPVEPYSWF